MSLCTCMEIGQSAHRIKEIGYWDGCALEGGRHTFFCVLRCLECGGVCFFPEENGKIALEEGTPESKARLAEIIDEGETKK